MATLWDVEVRRTSSVRSLPPSVPSLPAAVEGDDGGSEAHVFALPTTRIVAHTPGRHRDVAMTAWLFRKASRKEMGCQKVRTIRPRVPPASIIRWASGACSAGRVFATRSVSAPLSAAWRSAAIRL